MLLAMIACGPCRQQLVKLVSDFGSMSNYAQQTGAFCVLVATMVVAMLLFKLCQVGGTYTFSPASSVALTEMCKLALAVGLHARINGARDAAAWSEGVTKRVLLHYALLSAGYTANNQMAFYILRSADPGSLALFKSTAPYLVALMLRCTGQHISELQYVAVIINCLAIGVVQYDVCKGAGLLPRKVYAMMTFATLLTAATSVWNQKIVKGFAVPVNLQNAILYSYGTLFAILSFVLLPEERPVGFFEGYGPLAALLVLFQAFHGLAVTLVYKYADASENPTRRPRPLSPLSSTQLLTCSLAHLAVVKNFANATVMAFLVIISSIFFGLQVNVHSWLGIGIILTATHLYMNIALRAPPK